MNQLIPFSEEVIPGRPLIVTVSHHRPDLDCFIWLHVIRLAYIPTLDINEYPWGISDTRRETSSRRALKKRSSQNKVGQVNRGKRAAFPAF